MQTKKTKRPKGLIRRFIPYFAKYKAVLFFDLFCAALTTVCELVLPMLVRYVTNAGINDLASLTVGVVLKIGALYLFLRLVDAAANFFMASVGHIMGTKIETDMRTAMFDHLQKLSFNYFDNTKVAQIMTRITTDLFDVTEFAHHCPEEFFIAGIKIIGSFIILCGVNVWLTLIMFTIVPFIVLAAVYFNRKMKEQFRIQRVQLGEINAQVEDSLLGVRVVKSFANEELEKEKFEKGNQIFYNVKRHRYFYMGGFEASNRLFDGLMNLLVLVAGALFMINGQIEPADLVAYMLYVGTLITSIRRLVQFAEQFQQGMTGVERFFQVMDADVDIFDEPGAKPLQVKEGAVTFENVSFSYADDGKQVLSHINLDVKPGQNVALVGPSGGGKTTIARLIPRFFDVQAGAVLLGGRDVRSIPTAELMEQISFVFQEVRLFKKSIRDNIRAARPDATEAEILHAAQLAQCGDILEKTPGGLDAVIGSKGVYLSGGEMQRIALARAILKDAPIVVLDEASSFADPENEAKIQKAFEALMKGKTVLMIAHRLSTVRNMDRILVIRDGEIAEEGKHDELLEKGGVYAAMWEEYQKAAQWKVGGAA